MILPILGVTTPTDLSKININLVPQTAQVQPEKVEPTKYTVLENDSLTKIADKHQTTWQRLWQKNTHLTNQDILNVGEIIVIPSVDEVLADRPLYTLPVQENVSEPIKNVSRQVSVQGNGYEYKSCTWWVKQWKPTVGNWGDAQSWGYAAKAEGWTISSVPVVGAIAWTTKGDYGHVGLVIGIDDDSIVLQEGNYDWNGSVRTTSVPISTYKYIY